MDRNTERLAARPAEESPSGGTSEQDVATTENELLAVPGEEATLGSRLRRAALPSLLVAGGIGALELLRGRFQHANTFLPERYPDGLWHPENYGLPVEDVWFESADGLRLHGWWIAHRRARGTVLFCHGNAGNITHRIGAYRFLRRTGLNVLTFDYRGYGRSEGRPSERGVCADARSAHDFLVRELGEDPSRILLFGHSLGGAIAIDTALHRPVAGLVSQSTFVDLREMARERYPRLPLHLAARSSFKSIRKVAALDLPKLFIHGTSDETIPFSHGQRLFEEAAGPKEWYAIQGAGHNDVHRHGGLRYLWKLVRFSRRALQWAREQPQPLRIAVELA